MARAAFRVGIAALAAMLAVPAAAAETGPACELHVWGGGYPARVLKSNAFVKIKVDPAEADLTNPLSNASLYSTVNRARAWPDAELVKLMPADSRVTVIRHSEVVDLDKVKLKGVVPRLAVGADAPCYADLVIANIYGIFPNPDFQGLLVDAIDGGNRLVMDLWLQRWSGAAAAKPVQFRKKNDAPLVTFRALRPEYAASMEKASAQLLTDFALAFAKKHGTTTP